MRNLPLDFTAWKQQECRGRRHFLERTSRENARMPEMPELVLIVDDEPGILTTLGGILSDEGYSTLCTTSGEEALTLYEAERPAVVFLDIWLADRDGLETLQALRQADPTAAVIMMSGHGTAATAVKAIKMGAFDYLEKPLSYKRAVEAAAGALSYKRSLSERSE